MMTMKRLWTVEYRDPDGNLQVTAVNATDVAHVRYLFARYFPKVTVVSVRLADQEAP